MGFDWNEYLNLAEELARLGGEARLRSAISRAYYAVCLQVRFHKISGAPERNWDFNHGPMWSFVKQSRHRVGPQIGTIGRRMHERRCRADYQSDYPALEADVARTLEDAHKILELLPS